MPLTDYAYESAIGGTEPAKQRADIINESSTPPAPLVDHPMVQFAQSLMNPAAYMPQGFNPRATPTQAPPPPPVQQQDAPPSSAQLGVTARQASDLIGLKNYQSPVQQFLGGVMDTAQTTFNQGPLGGMLLGRDQRYAGVEPGSPEQAALDKERMQQLAFGLLGPEGAITGAEKAAAEAGGKVLGPLGRRIVGRSAEQAASEASASAAKVAQEAKAPGAAGGVVNPGEPPVAPGMVRLYRGQSRETGLGSDSASVKAGFAGGDSPNVRFFTTDKGMASSIARGSETGASPLTDRPGTGQVVYLDVPAAQAEALRLTNNPAALKAEMRISGYRGADGQIFVVPKEVASTAAELRAPGAAAGAPPLDTLVARQLDALRAGGATDQQIADFARTMAPSLPRVGTITSAEGQKVYASQLTRTIQAAAGSEGVPLAQHEVLGSAIKNLGPQKGGDIGAATRLVMSGNADAIGLFGDALTNELIQNKVAHIIRTAGAPEDVVRRGLGIMLKDRGGLAVADAEPAAIAAAGRNVKAVEDALTIPNPLSDLARADETGTETIAQAKQRLADQAGVDPITGRPLGGAGGPPNVPGAPPAEPPALPPAGRANAGDIAVNAALEVNALLRSALAGADLSTVLLQGAPLLVKDITKMPFYIASAARGGAQRPYFQTAFARLGQALVSGEAGMRSITQGFEDALVKNGMRPGKDVFISDPLGSVMAREELSAGSIIQKIPGLGLLYRQGNFGTTAFLNALRVGEAVNLKRAYEAVGLPFERERVGHLVNIATGRGDLPFANGEYADKTAKVMQGIFFGPRLGTAAIQNVTDTIKSLNSIGHDVLTRQQLKPVDVARIHTTASFVAAGWGIMKLAEASGLAIGTDPEATDFGRVTLPGGHRVDFWGPFNEEARLIAREIGQVASTARGEKPKYGAKTGEQLILDYVRSKLGPVAGAGASVLAGTNMGGKTPAEVISSTIANPNPLSNPDSMVPVPFTAQTVGQAFDPKQGGQGGLQAAGEIAAGLLGVSVLPPSKNKVIDGLGVAEGSPNFGKDPILAEHLKLTNTDMTPPNTTLGSKSNAIKLPPTEADAYIQQVTDARRVELGNLIYSEAYQNATQAQQAKMFDAAKSRADSEATVKYLATLIPNADPAQAAAEAITGFHAQGGNNKNEAYWIALLDRAGKLTPEVAKAIDDSNVTLPGQKAAITVEEYRKAAPLVHEYLSHAPYGTDARPIGTPEDWAAVEAAKQAQSTREDALIRSGTRPDVAKTTAHNEVLRSLVGAQQTIFARGSLLENPVRRQLSTKYGQTLTKFLGTAPNFTQETESAYAQFPFGQ